MSRNRPSLLLAYLSACKNPSRIQMICQKSISQLRPTKVESASPAMEFVHGCIIIWEIQIHYEWTYQALKNPINFDHSPWKYLIITTGKRDLVPAIPMPMTLTFSLTTIDDNHATHLTRNVTTYFLSLLRSISEVTFSPNKIVVWLCFLLLL